MEARGFQLNDYIFKQNYKMVIEEETEMKISGERERQKKLESKRKL